MENRYNVTAGYLMCKEIKYNVMQCKQGKSSSPPSPPTIV